jgi:hypothetical protein
MPDKDYVGREPLSLLTEAIGLVRTKIDQRHSDCHAFISTYGFQSAGVWWLEHMSGALSQMTVTVLFGIVEGASREHLKSFNASFEALYSWEEICHKFDETFHCQLHKLESYTVVERVHRLANYAKHGGHRALNNLAKAWPLCAAIVNDPERGKSQMWAGLPIEKLIAEVDRFLAALQHFVDGDGPTGPRGA